MYIKKRQSNAIPDLSFDVNKLIQGSYKQIKNKNCQNSKIPTQRFNDISIGETKKFNRKSQHRITSKSNFLGTSFQGSRIGLTQRLTPNGNSLSSILFPKNDIQSSKLVKKMKEMTERNCQDQNWKDSLSYNEMAQLMKKELHNTIKPLRINIQEYIYLTGNKLKYIKMKQFTNYEKELSTEHSIGDAREKNLNHHRAISILEK